VFKAEGYISGEAGNYVRQLADGLKNLTPASKKIN
jgi:hypothetical protein